MTKASGEAFIAALAASLQSTGVTANALLPGGPTATRMVADFGDPKTLLQPEIMAAPMAWLASDASDNVTGRRFIAAKWNAALDAAQAAQAACTPVALGRLRRQEHQTAVRTLSRRPGALHAASIAETVGRTPH